jgi:DNA mismatch repair protein MutL
MRILSLPTQVANQIAAGEVVERPASVVKELLENALDAHATHIQVDIGFGGLNQITVSDNGHGIVGDDLPLAVAPHATSKLRTLDDLSAINTMGFRGEALASIAAVSRLSIQSRVHVEPHGMRLHFEEGAVVVRPCARTPGTTIDIRDLFYNAPVRKKFLKTEALEYAAIESVVKRFAFSEPSVGLVLTHNGKKRLVLPPAPCDHTQRLRLRKLLGKTFLDHAMVVDEVREGMALKGWVSGAGYGRSQQDKQWIYLNRRMVKDKLMLHAIKQAYEPILFSGRYPACLLYLTMHTDEVDVNVHPTKHEVRFHDPRAVHDLIRSSIGRLIGDASFQPAVKPAYAPKTIASTTPVFWTDLNKRFAILTDQEVPYLVDVVQMRQNAQQAEWMNLPIPWVNRPLLVPVAIQVQTDATRLVAEYGDALQQYGFVVEAEPPHALRIRAIPRDFPAIDLHYLITQLVNKRPEPAALLQLLCLSDAWDLLSITAEEKSQWMRHWLETRPYSLSLDEDTCRGLLHV